MKRWTGLAALLLAISVVGCAPSNDDEPVVDERYVELMNRGVGMMGRFDFEAAGAFFESALALRPDSRYAALDLAISQLNRTEDDSQLIALEQFGEILREDPRQLRANYCSALAFIYLGRPLEAIAPLEIVVDQAPDDAYGNYFLAQALEQTGDLVRAGELYRTVTRLDPFLRSAWLGLQRTEARLDRPESARQALEVFEQLALNPRSRLAEFRYSRMGPLSMAVLQSTPPVATPSGVLAQAFSSPRQLISSTFAPDATLQVVDLEGDGVPEIMVAGGAPSGRSILLTQTDDSDGGWRELLDHPLCTVDQVNCMLFGDVDSNGTIDAFLCRSGVNRLLLQSTSGTWSEFAELPSETLQTLSGAIADLDHDGDLDIFCVNVDGFDALLNNNGDGSFRNIAESAGVRGSESGSRRVLVADLDLDRDADLVVLRSTPPHAVYLNDRLWRYRRSKSFDSFERSPSIAVTASYGTESGLARLRSLESDGTVRTWVPPTSSDPIGWDSADAVRLGSDGSPAAGELDLLDVSGDGVRELLVINGDSIEVLGPENQRLNALKSPSSINSISRILLDPARGCGLLSLGTSGGLIHHPAGTDRGGFATVQFSGRDDPAQQMRSNTSGIGVRWAARLGTHWQAGATWDSNSSPGQGLQAWTIGMGSHPVVDFLEIDWPDGVFQTELALEPGTHALTETQRQISSCPLVFTRGRSSNSFTFLTDVLGVGGLGYLLEPGVTAPPRPHEAILLPERPAQLRLAEPMEEACYLDRIAVHSIDVPEDCELVLDERLATAHPEATSQPLVVDRIIEVVQAVNDRGYDVTEAVCGLDQHAADPGTLDPRFIGLLEDTHVLELRFDQELSQSDVLLAEGWVEYPYSQTSFAAWQAGARYIPPSLEALDADGRWVMIAKEFGYPAGMPRAMALPLPPLPEGCRRLRLKSNQEIYWDRIRLGSRREVPTPQHALPMLSAEVAWCGFPRRTTGSQRQPQYDYQKRDPFGDVRHQAGFYTDFGRCEPLVVRADDACAIIGPGEEFRVRFDEQTEPPLAAGYRRYWVLELDGWCKDMDLFTVEGERLEPLPARSGESPSEAARELMKRFNRRFASGR
ncbi:MAG: hypothetical protein CBC35_11010 [Planctomycetes bacterium TMED75]|nr:hypothetical protein [Planctomycetaceae bacterium]OUU90781.1 MAG: hypothetical protein CBC35_11010 [Planctomycetes bacterium TMED75]